MPLRPADPRPPTGSICDVLPAAGAALGVPGAVDRLGLGEQLAGVRRIVLILVDGLGWHLLERAAPHAPLLAAALRGSLGHAQELHCGCPSTTPTSLVSLGTGAAPGAHGVLGFTVAVPGTDRVLTHIFWRDDPPPATWAPVRTCFEQAAAAGIDARVVLPALFEGGGLTYAAYRGARFCAVESGEDYVGRLVAEVAAGPGLIYGYTSVLDTAAHVSGIASPQWARAAAEVDVLLSRVLAQLPPDAALLVTADHGGLDVPPDGRFDLDADPDLAHGVRLVAGEPRVRYLHTERGAAGDVAASWREILGDAAQVLLRDEAVAAGLFGPVPAAHLPRLGDVIAICTGPTAVMASRHEPPEYLALIGLHGAMDPVETAIPLLTLRG